ncbi:MAG: hypothetical protein ACRCRT_06090, partial [Cetobacterium somerae]
YYKLSCVYFTDTEDMEYLQIGQSMYKIIEDNDKWESFTHDMGSCEEECCRCAYNVTKHGDYDCIENGYWMLYNKQTKTYHDFLCHDIAFQDHFRYQEVEFNSVPEGAKIFELVAKGEDK